MSVRWFSDLSRKGTHLRQASAVPFLSTSCSQATAGSPDLPNAESPGARSTGALAQTEPPHRTLSAVGGECEVSVETAIGLALENDPELLSAREELTVARGSLAKARYWNPYNPRIGGGAGQRHFDQGGTDVQPGAEVSLEVEIAGQRGKRIEEAEHAFERAQAELADFERPLRGHVKEAFYSSLHGRRRLALFHRTSQLNSRLRNATPQRFRSGEVARLDQNFAAIRDGWSGRDVFQAERDYTRTLLEVERPLGREPAGRIVPRGSLEVDPLAFDRAALLPTALEDRPKLVARHAEIRRLEAQHELTRRSIIPNLPLGAFYDEEAEAVGQRDRIFGGRVSFPLPVFDRKQGALRGRHAQAWYDRQARF